MSDSYETIRTRIIERFPKDDDIREGSPLAIAVSPTARYLADNILVEVEESKKEAHPLTASREHLITEAALYGINPYEASPAVAEGKFNIACAIGDRFTINGLVFRITEPSETKEEGFFFYYLECETPGDVGNVSSGRLTPVMLHEGLVTSLLVRIVINGENEEDTESFRSRFQASFNSQGYGGNVADYYLWLSAIPGVGRAKILACEDPEGTIGDPYVTIVITNSNNEKATEELCSLAQDRIAPKEPIDYKKHGYGLAPIGADVYFISAKERVINLSFTVESELSKKEEIKQTLEEFIAHQNLEWGNTTAETSAYYPKTQKNVHIRTAQIISTILAVPDVIDVTDLTINGGTENIDLNWDEIAKLGEINETDRLPTA